MDEGAVEGEAIYLEFADALELYAANIGAIAAQAADQLRDRSGLEGAVSRAQAYAHYELESSRARKSPLRRGYGGTAWAGLPDAHLSGLHR